MATLLTRDSPCGYISNVLHMAVHDLVFNQCQRMGILNLLVSTAWGFLVFGFSAFGKHSSCLVLVPLELIVEIIIHILLGLMYKHEMAERNFASGH